jgi:hypothetical protein
MVCYNPTWLMQTKFTTSMFSRRLDLDMQVLPLIAEAPSDSWPDAVDLAALSGFVLLAVGLPAIGYVFMALDIRRYLRSLRRALVVVATFTTRRSPDWSLRDCPPCLQTFGLTLPCTEQEVLAAYRQRVKEMHPDRGGDMRQFLRLQQHFEQAMHLARSRKKIRTVSVK